MDRIQNCLSDEWGVYPRSSSPLFEGCPKGITSLHFRPVLLGGQSRPLSFRECPGAESEKSLVLVEVGCCQLKSGLSQMC